MKKTEAMSKSPLDYLLEAVAASARHEKLDRLARIMGERVAGRGAEIRRTARENGDSLRITIEDALVCPGRVGDADDIDAELVAVLFGSPDAPAWWPGHFDGWDLGWLLRFRSPKRAADWIYAQLLLEADDIRKNMP